MWIMNFLGVMSRQKKAHLRSRMMLWWRILEKAQNTRTPYHLLQKVMDDIDEVVDKELR